MPETAKLSQSRTSREVAKAAFSATTNADLAWITISCVHLYRSNRFRVVGHLTERVSPTSILPLAPLVFASVGCASRRPSTFDYVPSMNAENLNCRKAELVAEDVIAKSSI